MAGAALWAAGSALNLRGCLGMHPARSGPAHGHTAQLRSLIMCAGDGQLLTPLPAEDGPGR